MYFDQSSASRTWAPRIGTRLCMLCVQFSAMHSQPRSGKKKFISAGASEFGRQLEHDPHTVDDEFLARVRDVLGRGDQAGRQRAGSPCRARSRRAGAGRRAAADRTGTPHGGLIAKPAMTFSATDLAQEVLGSDHPAPSGVDIGLGGHAEHAAEVVDVGVGVDHRRRPAARRGARWRAPGRRAHVALDGERVDDDPSRRRRR